MHQLKSSRDSFIPPYRLRTSLRIFDTTTEKTNTDKMEKFARKNLNEYDVAAN